MKIGALTKTFYVNTEIGDGVPVVATFTLKAGDTEILAPNDIARPSTPATIELSEVAITVPSSSPDRKVETYDIVSELNDKCCENLVREFWYSKETGEIM